MVCRLQSERIASSTTHARMLSGEYALAVPADAMNLRQSGGGGGFFYQVTRMIGSVGKIAGYGLKPEIRVARDAATGQTVDPLTKVGVGAASNIANDVVDVMGDTDRKKNTADAASCPALSSSRCPHRAAAT